MSYNQQQAQRANRNASSFNIISYEATGSNHADIEKQLKKYKQQAYRDQLDQMKTIKQDSRAQDRQQVGGGGYSASLNIGGVSRGPSQPQYEQRQPQYEQRGGNSGREPESYTSIPDYGLDNRAAEVQRNYNLGAQSVSPGYIDYQNQLSRPASDQQRGDTFEQQDQLRSQLLDKIRSGYNNQNFNVYNAYQRAHEERELDKQHFEANVIDKAAREKAQKEQEAAMRDWDKKRRLQFEVNEANKRAIDAKSSQKRREKEIETISDQRRNQDAIQQHQQSEYVQKEKFRRMQDETSQALDRQLHQSNVAKSKHGKEISPTKFKVGWDSIDNIQNQPLKNSSQLNQDPYANSKIGSRQYNPQSQYEDVSYGVGKLDIGGGDQYQPQSYGGYSAPYGEERQPASKISQGGRGKVEFNGVSDKNRQNAGFNIITGEYR